MNNLRELFKGLDLSPKQEEKQKELYYVLHVPRSFGENEVIARNLTKSDAQNMVSCDMEINPKAEEYMIIYKKQLN